LPFYSSMLKKHLLDVYYFFSEDNDNLCLEAGVWSLDGKKCLLKKDDIDIKVEEGPPKKVAKRDDALFAGIQAGKLDEQELILAEALGIRVAEELIEAGGLEIMQEARAENEKPEAKAQIIDAIKEVEANGNAQVAS